MNINIKEIKISIQEQAHGVVVDLLRFNFSN